MRKEEIINGLRTLRGELANNYKDNQRIGFIAGVNRAIEFIHSTDESETLSIDKEQLIKSIENYIPLYDKTVGDVVEGILEVVKQLPEMKVLSQEWVNEHSNGSSRSQYVWVDDLKEILVPKQELPVIPDYVAEWIDTNKEKYDLVQLFWEIGEGGLVNLDVDRWIEENPNTFARAWLDGYEVAEEQKYIVRLPSSMQDAFPIVALGRINKGNLSVIKNRVGINLTLHDKYLLTEQEIKDYDPRYMTFAKPVEELEE